MALDDIIAVAKAEIAEEDFREAVEAYKLKLRNKVSLWDRIFPFKIIFVRKKNV